MSENWVQKAFAVLSIIVAVICVALAITALIATGSAASLAAQPWTWSNAWLKLAYFGGNITNGWIAAGAWALLALIAWAIGAMVAPETMAKYGDRLVDGFSSAVSTTAAAVKSMFSAVASALPWWVWAIGAVVLWKWLAPSDPAPAQVQVTARAPALEDRP